MGWVPAAVSVIGGIIGANQQHHAAQQAQQAADQAASGQSGADAQIQHIVNYLLGPDILNNAVNNLDVTSNRDLNSIMNRMGGGIVNPGGTINDWRDQTLQDAVQLIGNIKTQAPQEAGSLEEFISGQYGAAGQNAANNLANINAQPNPLLGAIMGIAGGGGNLSSLASLFAPKAAAVPGVTPAAINNAGPINDTAGTLPSFGALPGINPVDSSRMVGASGYFGGPNGMSGNPAVNSLLALLGHAA